jgi:hypothetical protein
MSSATEALLTEGELWRLTLNNVKSLEISIRHTKAGIFQKGKENV